MLFYKGHHLNAYDTGLPTDMRTVSHLNSQFDLSLILIQGPLVKKHRVNAQIKFWFFFAQLEEYHPMGLPLNSKFQTF